MSNKIKVNLSDKYRVLLTEVLPYELPLWFTNFNFYKICKDENKIQKYRVFSGQFEKKSVFIPLDYRISRGDSLSARQLSIMHPLAQIKVCDFYEKYDELIKYYCSKSNHSLRYPYRKSRQFYGKTEIASKVNLNLEIDGYESKVSSSYFKYKTFAFLYKFFENYEHHKLEKRFSFMLQVDIAKCFPSIYTHSLGWATKSKRQVKEDLKKSKGSFDAEFDSLMQMTNYKETNGIIVGPEISRIFAEIILQRIDLNIVSEMDVLKHIEGKDYQFKRYVDDYFVFYNSKDVQKDFFKSLEKSLLEYKLYLNEAKTEEFKRPFVTNISLAKHSLRNSLRDFYSKRYRIIDDQGEQASSTEIIECRSASRMANKAIAEIKFSFSNYNVSYQSVSNYLMSSISKNINKYVEILKKVEIENVDMGKINWLLVDLDILFFIHAMDIRVRPTDRMAKIIVGLINEVGFIPEGFKKLIFQKIFDQVRLSINLVSAEPKNINGVETLNLLLILTRLPTDYLLPSDILRKYYSSICSSKEISQESGFYFVWITFMLYISKYSNYEDLKLELLNDAHNFLKGHPDNFISTEFFLFYFDFIACPQVPDSLKSDLVEFIKNKTQLRFEINEALDYLKNNDFITSWRDPNYLINSLEKKEFTFSY